MINYAFYKDTFHGTMTEAEFTRFANPARAYIHAICNGRAENYTEDDKVKFAFCAIADAYRLNEQGGGVVSETVGKVSRNYAAGISNTPTETQRIERAAKLYLSGTGLLYRGCRS